MVEVVPTAILATARSVLCPLDPPLASGTMTVHSAGLTQW
jgi:hypothetical protein